MKHILIDEHFCIAESVGIFYKDQYIPLKITVRKFDLNGNLQGELSTLCRPTMQEIICDESLPEYLTLDLLSQAPASYIVANRVQEFIGDDALVEKENGQLAKFLQKQLHLTTYGQ